MAKTQTVTILFCDLVSSTERRIRLGDDVADEFIERFIAALQDAVARNDGQEIKNVGDGLQAAFPDSAADAVTCAIDMHRAMPALDPDDPPQLRIGISSGEVARKGSDWSGTPVVEAARLQAAAQPGQTLASHVVRSLVGTRRALRFRDVGALALKGLSEPLSSVEVVDEFVADLPTPPRAPLPAAPPAPASAPRPRNRLIIAIVAVVVVLVAASITAMAAHSGGKHTTSHVTTTTLPGLVAPKGYTPRFVTIACPAAIHSNTPDATCGDLIVPQDRSKPEGMSIRLLVTRVPVETSGPPQPPTIDIGGHDDPASSPVRNHSELIQIGDRGFGDGTPDLACPEVAPVLQDALGHPSGDPASFAKATQAIGHCYRRLTAAGIDPGDYNLEAAGDDVIDLMVALKIPRADLLSGEAESAAAFQVLREAPGAVRSITLEDPFPPGDGYLNDPTGDLAAAFNAYVALCANNPTCSDAYPNLLSEFEAARNHFSARPTVVDATCACDTSLPPIPVALDGYRATDALFEALSESATLPFIPASLSPTPVSSVIAPYAREYSLLTTNATSVGGNLSYFCSYFVHVIDTSASDLSARTYPEFVGSNSQIPWTKFCAQWKVPDVSGPLSVEISGPTPMLLLRGDISPIGNPQWLADLQRSLPNATIADFPTLGNDLLTAGPPCLSGLRSQFLANPKAKLDVTACTRQSPPVRFEAP